LCVTFTTARGRVVLFDLEARQLMSHWSLPAGTAGYSDAGGVAMDDRFHLFVADTCNDRLRHYSAFGRHLTDLGLPGDSSGQKHHDRAGVLHRPHAVAHFGDVLYVACGERPLRRGVQRFHRDGKALRPLLPQGDTEGMFGAPRGVWADARGILVADTLHGQVLCYRSDGLYLAAMATGERGEASRPQALIRLVDGRVLFMDHGDRPGPRLLAVDGRLQPVPPVFAAQVADVLAFARDAQERLYVLDRHGERVQRFAPDLAFDAPVVDLMEHFDDFAEPAT